MKFSELIEHAIVCIKGFNPVIKTLDSHADEFIAQVSSKENIRMTNDADRRFAIVFIVHGSLREGVRQASFLWLHALLRIPQGKSSRAWLQAMLGVSSLSPISLS